MMKRIDRGLLFLASTVAGSLMFGALTAAWLRALDAVAGRTAYSLAAYSAMLTAGLLIGFAAAEWPCRKMKEPANIARMAFLFIGCWLVFQLAAIAGVVGGWQRIPQDLSRSFMQYGLALGKTSAFFTLLLSVAMGCVWRAALQHGARPVSRKGGQSSSRVVFLALVPSLAGYVIAAYLVVPEVGVESLTRVAALWFGALSTLVLLRSVWSLIPFALVAGVLCALNPQSKGSVLTNGIYSRLVHRDSGFARGTPVYTHHSRHHTVAVYDDPDYQFVLTLDGRPILFGNRFHIARTLTAYVPLMLHPACKKAAVFGPEAGLYIPFLVRGGITDVSYAGADAEVVKLTLATDGCITGDDVSIRGAVKPGATLSPHSGYDLIFLAAEPVWMRGTGGAYGRSWFGQCREALSENGLVAVHLDARALPQRRFVTIARMFAQEFPDMQVWCTGAYDWVLVGGRKAVRAQADRMLGMFENASVVRDFARAGVLSLPEVLACFVCDGPSLSPWLDRSEGEAAWQTVWRAPRTVFGEGEPLLQPVTLEASRQRKLGWIVPGALDEEVYLAIRDKADKYIGARTFSAKALEEKAKGKGDSGMADARAASRINPRDVLLLQLSESLELEGRRRIAIGEFKGGLRCYENMLSFSPGAARGHYGMGYCLRANGDNENAYLHFARAVAAAPEVTGYRLELAQVAATIGEYKEADRQYLEVLKREPKNAEALFRFAKTLAFKERTDKDLARAVKMAEQACVLTAWKNKEYAFGLADLYMDAGRVMEGMGLKRRLKEIGRTSGNPGP